MLNSLNVSTSLVVNDEAVDTEDKVGKRFRLKDFESSSIRSVGKGAYGTRVQEGEKQSPSSSFLRSPFRRDVLHLHGVSFLKEGF